MADYTETAAFRGATFQRADLSGATFRECDLSGVRIVGSLVGDLRVSGFGGESGTVVVDDVDVTEYVAAELDRRHPERVALRAMRTADDHRAMWDTVERLWADARERAERLPEPARHERVAGEWSFVETLRHLVFAVDGWVGRMVLGEAVGYDPRALPPTDYPAAEAPALGLDLDARPSYDEAVALHLDRLARVRGVLDGLTDDALAEVRTGMLAPVWGTESHTVGECLRVVMVEHCAHRRFALRDLAALA